MIVQTVIMDMQSDKNIAKLMENVVVNTSSTKEHVAEMERTTRTVRDRTGCIFTTMPLKYPQELLVANM